MTPLKVFIGYDSKEPVAFSVAAHSLLQRASKPVSIIPLVQSQLRAAGLYTRDRGATESTEFSLTRFLVPHLCDYDGLAVFVDCDVLFRADIYDVLLYVLANPDRHVHVCQHEYTPKASTKFLGQVQTIYPRKNWSSFMVFDTAKCRALTPAYVNTASGLELHRLHWVPDGLVGSLPLEWNWLVGEYPPNGAAHVLHYTDGGPWFDEYRNCDHAGEWRNGFSRMVGHGSCLSLQGGLTP